MLSAPNHGVILTYKLLYGGGGSSLCNKTNRHRQGLRTSPFRIRRLLIAKCSNNGIVTLENCAFILFLNWKRIMCRASKVPYTYYFNSIYYFALEKDFAHFFTGSSVFKSLPNHAHLFFLEHITTCLPQPVAPCLSS